MKKIIQYIFNHQKNQGNEIFLDDGIIPTAGESVSTNEVNGLHFSKAVRYKLLSLFVLLVGGTASLVVGQYFYFDTGGISGYPYQQGCSEQLYLNVTTETDSTGAGAGLITLQFDPTYFSYTSGNISTLFSPSTLSFRYYLGPPTWKDVEKTILYIDRNNGGSNRVGNDRYGILSFIPEYNAIDYTGNFLIIYNGNETVTSLSYNGVNIINSGHQYAHVTGAYYVYQKPCTDDNTSPTPTITDPAGSNKISYLSGITITLTENVGAGSVPYVRTGGLPGIGIWTGNDWSINNQYGVNFDTFEITISGNGSTRYFTGGMFSPAGTLSVIANGVTRQFRDKNYTVAIDSSELFDYGIEQLIDIDGNVSDRAGNSIPIHKSFNNPQGPTIIPSLVNPTDGENDVLTTTSVILGIQDEWAGVDSGTIVVTLQGIAGTTYGPYIFTGSSLNLSGILGDANLPDYHITISGHVEFPSSGHIQVNVYAEDINGNVSSITPYSFNTKPSCADLGCCNNVYLQTGSNPPFYYSGFILYVSGGINPYFTVYGNTGTIYCGTENEEPMDIYKGTEDQSGTATFLSIHDLPNLILSGGINIRATLSGITLYLESTNVLVFTVKAFPSNRVNQDTNNQNTGVLRFYDATGNILGTSLPFTLNGAGTGRVLINIDTGTYYVGFRGQSHLTSYLSGVMVDGLGEQVFDFTTGNNLFGTQNLDSATDDGNQYQTAGDLINSVGVFDHLVNGNDLTVIIGTPGHFPEASDVLNPRNLNGDDEINASDIGIIGTNFLKQDPFFQDSLNPSFNRFVW